MSTTWPFFAGAVVLVALANVFLHKGMKSLSKAESLLATLTHALRTPAVWAGGFTYVAAMGFWLKVLSIEEIGLAYPVFSGLSTTLVIFVSVTFLKDRLEPRRVAGVVLMLTGILVAHFEF